MSKRRGRMSTLDKIAYWVLILGAIDLGIVALTKTDYLLNNFNTLARLFYFVFFVAGIYAIVQFLRGKTR